MLPLLPDQLSTCSSEDTVTERGGVEILALVGDVQRSPAGAARSQPKSDVRIDCRVDPIRRDQPALDARGVVEVDFARERHGVELAGLLVVPRLILARVRLPIVCEDFVLAHLNRLIAKGFAMPRGVEISKRAFVVDDSEASASSGLSKNAASSAKNSDVAGTAADLI